MTNKDQAWQQRSKGINREIDNLRAGFKKETKLNRRVEMKKKELLERLGT